jgi:CheY-like chemotaxis protein
MDKKKILVIDDEDHARKMIRTFFENYTDVSIIEAGDGDTGFELAKKEQPDLVLLDNKMPQMSGEQTAKMIRADSSTRTIPIILITAMSLTENEVNLIKLDVNEFIQKPFSPWVLKKMAEKYVGTLSEI